MIELNESELEAVSGGAVVDIETVPVEMPTND